MADAKTNFGRTIKIGATSTPSVTLINVTGMTLPKATRDAVDMTTHASPDGYAEYLADGVIDSGEGMIAMNYIAGNADDVACLAAFAAGNYYLQWPAKGASAVRTFTAAIVVTEYGEDEGGLKGKQSATLKFKISGKVTVV